MMCIWVKEDLVALAIHRAERAMLVTSRAIIAVNTIAIRPSTTFKILIRALAKKDASADFVIRYKRRGKRSKKHKKRSHSWDKIHNGCSKNRRRRMGSITRYKAGRAATGSTGRSRWPGKTTRSQKARLVIKTICS